MITSVEPGCTQTFITMKKCVMLAAMFFVGITASSAQEIREMFGSDQKGKILYGIRAGLNVSNLAGEYGPDSGDELDFDSRVGFHVGGVVDIPITNGFYVQPGLLFSTRGAKDKYSYSESGYSEEATSKYRPIYLEIPVLASFRADVSSAVNVQVNVGPHFAFGLGGQCKEAYNDSDGNSESVKYPFFGESTDKEDHFGAKRFDFGLTFGAGVMLWEHYYVGIAYDFGLVNMAVDKEWGDKAKFRNRNFSIQLGYNF